MPISNKDYGIHEEVLFLDFGYGDILITEGKALDKELASQLIFSQDEPHEVGETSEKYRGKLSDEIPNVKTVFDFKSVASIDVLINKLQHLKNAMLADKS